MVGFLAADDTQPAYYKFFRFSYDTFIYKVPVALFTFQDKNCTEKSSSMLFNWSIEGCMSCVETSVCVSYISLRRRTNGTTSSFLADYINHNNDFIIIFINN